MSSSDENTKKLDQTQHLGPNILSMYFQLVPCVFMFRSVVKIKNINFQLTPLTFMSQNCQVPM